VVLVLVLLFLVLPVAELYVLVQVAQAVGILESLALLVVVSVVGAWLVKREGLGLLARIQRDLAAGKLPATQVVDGFLVLFAGALLLTPGFLTDVLAISLLFPPTRALVRVVLLRRFRDRLEVYRTGDGFFAADGMGGRVASWGATAGRVDIVDVVGRHDDPSHSGELDQP
jgi:UPF0716 protein FxsA